MYKVNKEELYRYMFYFIFFSFLGWVFETTVMFIETGNFHERGFLFIQEYFSKDISILDYTHTLNFPLILGLPVIGMYGLGGIIAIFLLKHLSNNLIKVFILGMIYMTIFELVGSYWCEYILKQVPWDYSKNMFNFQGRICLSSTIAWGALCVLMLKYIEPVVYQLHLRLSSKKYYHIVLIVLMLYVFVCASVRYFIPVLMNYI